MREPIAIVGMACLYPKARGLDAFWERLSNPEPAREGASDLSDVEIDLAQFGIPPAQRGSMARMQLLMLEVARQCLVDAGHPGRPLRAERTDVVVGVCFGLDRQYANALRVAGAGYGREVERAAAQDPDERVRTSAEALRRELRESLTSRLGAAAHDRVGEMASSIPARIASAFRFRGRTLAMESADATSFVALEHALHSLRSGTTDTVLLITGQGRDGEFAAQGLTAKGVDPGAPLSEGITAILLKRRRAALSDGDRIYASILAGALCHEPRPGAFRYSTNVAERLRIAKECHDAAGVHPAALRYVERVGPASHGVTEAESRSLQHLFGDSAAAPPQTFSTASDRFGPTFANAGLASVACAALTLHHGVLPPSAQKSPRPQCHSEGRSPRCDQPADAAEVSSPSRSGGATPPAEPEPASRYAAICGSALGGTFSYLLLAREDASDHLRQHAEQPSSVEPIAIVGIGGTFAGAPEAAMLWQTIESGRTGLDLLPESILDRDLYFAPGTLTLTHSYCQVGGSVPVPQRPPTALDITPHRYRAMDPAQRLALSVADELLNSYPHRSALRGRRGLVAMGTTLCLTSERNHVVARSTEGYEAALTATQTWTRLPAQGRARILDRVRKAHPTSAAPLSPADLDGSLASGIAALIANEYQLEAVPVAVEAACASTLATIDVALASLRAGSSDFAIVGGIEFACNPRDLVLCSALGLLSHTVITPFDAAADGFSPGDGCAMFLLKRLSDARRDGDAIAGLIRSIGASNDARSLIAPDVAGQVLAMQRAFDAVDFDPDEVDYLEAHGTGTRVGDRVETEAAATVYGGYERASPLVIGSVKAVVGHTFSAAGGAGLLQAIQAMQAKTYPPNASLRAPNPSLALSAIPAVLPTTPQPWPTTAGRPRRAGVSSFGTGGINYHLLLEEYPLEASR
ncbi:polyketide synthase [Nocardia sp. NPDC050435]|uniref:beta-ketoacyl [acyl carrier protein] synthase domain-containing protein n=1 Tax=Nocardia sp. NPDC050435 TaxID=3155040 RepID=UPI0033E0390A